MIINLDEMTQEGQQAILAKLTERFVGAIPVGLPPYDLCLPLVSEEIRPGCVGTISVAPHISCNLKRLVVFNTQIVHSEDETVEKWCDVTTGHWWWKKTHRVLGERRLFVHRFDRIFPRGSWNILTALVGNKLIFPTFSAMVGDLFAPDGELGFNMPCEHALCFTLSVKNNGTDPAMFRGAVLGNAIEEETTTTHGEEIVGSK